MPLHEEHKKRRGRNWAIAGFLFVMVALFYAASFVKVQESLNAGG